MGRRSKQVPLAELTRYFRVPSNGIAVDYPGREILLGSRITNLSINGVFINTRSPFAKGIPVQISFRLPGVERAINAACMVRWSTASNPAERPADYDLDGMGLEFTDISRRDRKAIMEYITAFLNRIRSTDKPAR